MANNNIRKLEKRKRIALIAHDNKKRTSSEWAIYNKSALAKRSLVSHRNHRKINRRSPRYTSKKTFKRTAGRQQPDKLEQ
jgi:hypothetical protein